MSNPFKILIVIAHVLVGEAAVPLVALADLGLQLVLAPQPVGVGGGEPGQHQRQGQGREQQLGRASHHEKDANTVLQAVQKTARRTKLCGSMLASLLSLQLALTPAPAAPPPAPEAAFAQGTQRYRDAEFESALPLFQRAASTPDTGLRARAELWMGLTFFNLGNTRAARESFRAALIDDPKVVLPDDAPPPAVPMFSNLRSDLERSAPRPVPPEMQSRPPAPQPDVPRADEHPAAPTDEPRTFREVPEAHEGSGAQIPRWLPSVVVGAGAGVGVVAGGLKLASSSRFDDATRSRSAAEAASLSRSADGQQHLARTLAVTAVGLVAVATVLYLLRS